MRGSRLNAQLGNSVTSDLAFGLLLGAATGSGSPGHVGGGLQACLLGLKL